MFGLRASPIALSFVLFIAVHSHAAAAPAGPPTAATFIHIGLDDDLPNQQTWSVLQDATGFMWFATDLGLSRYDGYETVNFRHDAADPTSLGGTLIRSLYQDHGGALWVASLGVGLDALDPHTDRFVHYRHAAGDPRSLSSDNVSAIAEDSSGALWVGTFGAGLNRLDRATNTFTAFRHQAEDPRSLSDDTVTALYTDAGGTLWVGTADGLNRLDANAATFTTYRHDPNDATSLAASPVTDILQDASGVLWVATRGDGLDRLDVSTGGFVHYRHDTSNSNSLSNDRLGCIAEDSADSLWVATQGGGLSVLDPTRQRFTTYAHDPGVAASLSSDFVTCVRVDRSGLVWSTGQAGVDTYNPRQQVFTVFRADRDVSTTLASDNLTAVYEAHDDAAWVGTQDHGLDRLDRRTGVVAHYPLDVLGHAWVSAIDGDDSGNIWVGTYGEGLYRLDPGSGIWRHYQHGSTADSLASDYIRAVAVDDANQAVWIGTDGAGLDRLDLSSEKFLHTRRDPNDAASLSSNEVTSLARGAPSTIWAGTWGGGLNDVDPQTGNVIRYQHDPSLRTSLANDFVSSVQVDSVGALWVGTGDGLDHFDPASASFGHFTVADGLASNTIQSLVEDIDSETPRLGDMWIGTADALSRFDRGTQSFRTYGLANGLPPGTNFRQGISAGDGNLLMASDQGLIVFCPTNLLYDKIPPPVVVTSFQIDNKAVTVGPGSPLQQSIDETTAISVPYTDRVITFEFAALSYAAPRMNRYRYMLDGFDDGWTEVPGNRRAATYTNLDPGTYTFRVTGSNSAGVWNPTGRSIELTIVPPWWMTWWFRVVAVAGGMATLLAIYALRVNRLNVQRRELEGLVAQRTTALESALASRDAFLRMLAHDLKAPLAALSWQVQTLMISERAGDLTPAILEEGLEAVAAGAAEAASAIDELHDLTRIEMGAALPLHLESLDVCELVTQLVSAGTLTAGHTVTLDFVQTPLVVSGDRARLNRVLSNLLENAAKYSPAGAPIVVVLLADDVGGPRQAVVRVIDSGIGIPTTDLPRVFERYHRGANVARIPGEGLGLASVRALVELHHGTVDVDSREGFGTIITVRLPMA